MFSQPISTFFPWASPPTSAPAASKVDACNSLEESFYICERKSSPFPDIAPEDSVLESHLLPLPEKVGTPSSHSVEIMVLQEQAAAITSLRVFFKKCDSTYPPSLAQIEAAASASSRLTRGGKFARIRTVINGLGFVIGSISHGFTDFKPMYQYTFTLNDLIKYNAAKSLVNRYVKQDDDFHPGNAGIAKVDDDVGETWVDIDGDMFYYPMTSQIKGPRVINNGFFAPILPTLSQKQ